MLTLESIVLYVLRGQILKDQLLFEAEIERVVKRNKKTKTKENKEILDRNAQPLFLFPLILFKRRATWQKSKHHLLGGHLEIIPCTKALEMKLVFLSLISTLQFTVMDHEDPYTHLATFYELVGTMGFQSGDIENVYICLFPFSLDGKAKE